MKRITAVVLLMFSALSLADNGNRVWLDVRSAEEFAAGHLEGAINIPHGEVVAGVQALNIDKDTPLVLYCRSGRRAQMALEALQKAGYQNLVNAEDEEGARALKAADAQSGGD
ncbi:rhodanese-like domain-containing protein [Gilvimarinus algae]|uniref:Rhodanese-like domain-containing protein n=1 Tax=Gilvimarinus algae TaxID=3058037 RepID=A0ABT8TEC0_9GAMM|nr:rhodanese-like domain-containing protein [Gilvimarinus sp. SDUM040014]MDO3382305.1 rhodanese-like domain-containing protein [Gilvimarinus sp. SDUM040014]